MIRWIEHILAAHGLFWLAIIIGMTFDQWFIQPRKKGPPVYDPIRDYLRLKPVKERTELARIDFEKLERRIINDMHVALKNHFRYLNGKKMR